MVAFDELVDCFAGEDGVRMQGMNQQVHNGHVWNLLGELEEQVAEVLLQSEAHKHKQKHFKTNPPTSQIASCHARGTIYPGMDLRRPQP